MDRMSWKRVARIGLLVIFWMGISGCDLFTYTTLPERQPETGKPIALSYRFDDIPIPPGMTLNRKESFVYEARATKTGLLVYEGKGEMERVVLFFKQQMPNYKWRLASNFELQNVMLAFMKEGWIAVIYILPVDQDSKRLEIRVGPIDLKCQ